MHSDPACSLRVLLEPGKRFVAEDAVARGLLLAEAYARTGDFANADVQLGRAGVKARQLKSPDLMAAVGYRSIRRHLFAEDPRSARIHLPLARSGRSLESRLNALFAESAILQYEERVTEQAQKLVELLRLIDPAQPEFYEMRAWATHSLAILARELPIAEAAVSVERQLGGLPWPQDFAQNRFQSLKALGWAKALQGDYFNAFRHLKWASTVADTNAWKCVAACDRAYLARRYHESRWSRVELDEAEQLAAEVNWQATVGEERIALLLLAELFTPLDAARSAMYLAKYRELGDIKSPIHYRHDARIKAFEQFSTAIVEVSLGNAKRGAADFRRAGAVFERFGYDFRVAQCLVQEAEITGNSSLLDRARDKLRSYTQSWLYLELQHSALSNATSLPRMQQLVFEKLCQGKSTAEIAQHFGRSEFTISNHIKQIFRRFGVTSRSALVAKAAAAGLIGP
jgi:DNA-binding CsgD family transcriptional regulator